MQKHCRMYRWTEPAGRLANRLTFSSFSRSPDDAWACDIERPYAIRLLPGYTIPEALDRGSKDSLWFPEGKCVEEPVIVWDGFCEVALHEIILECMDPLRESPFIEVINLRTGDPVPDPRREEILAVRPIRPYGVGSKRAWNHIVELSFWAALITESQRTSEMYLELLSPSGDWTSRSVDSIHRQNYFYERKIHMKGQREAGQRMLDAGLSRESDLVKGPPLAPDSPRREDEANIPLLQRTADILSLYESISLDDLPADGSRPDSYYALVRANAMRNLRGENEVISRVATKRAEKITQRNPRGLPVVGEFPVREK